MSNSELAGEISELESALGDSSSPIVFTHNDLVFGNIIHDQNKGKVTFIDLEYGNANYLVRSH